MNLSSYQYEVAIIGAGFAGLGMGIRLKNLDKNSFIIFERAKEVGGTWRDNTYPGCGCDVPSLLYSYSFAPNPNWSRGFSKQAEILEYAKDCRDKYELNEHIRYETEIIYTEFLEEKGFWLLKDRQDNIFTARCIVAAVGPLNVPNIPNINGLKDFKGKFFHSSEWDHEYDLKDKKVAVIGTGASAIQFVPEIAKAVKNLQVFQRTAPWITPKPDKEVGQFSKNIFKRFPTYQKIWRTLIYWILEMRGLGLMGNKLVHSLMERQSLNHIKNSIQDPELRKAVTPTYKIGCKRILLSDDYYPALTRENVSLITTPIEQIKAHSIVTKDGQEHPIDALILGTGFHVAEFVRDLTIIGRNKRSLLKEWETTGPEAYYGITTSGYPNLLFMVGPNTGLGHNSIIHMMESQINYILDYLTLLEQGEKTSYLDLKSKVEEDFLKEHQAQFEGTVWASGCDSWYQNEEGKNTTLWAGLTVTYRKKTKRVNPDDYNRVVVEKEIKESIK